MLVRISRSGDALTIRAKAGDGALQLVRVVPLAPAEEAQAGPFICAPTRAGLAVPFHAWRTTEPDGALH
ncbi:hypothetical protein D3C85_1826620 [compost metagenome]